MGAFHPPIKTSSRSKRSGSASPGMRARWGSVSRLLLAARSQQKKQTNAKKPARITGHLLCWVFGGGGGSGPGPQFAPPRTPLKESRIARRPEASRCPLALTCHSRERPLQRHGSDVCHGNGSHPGLTSARFVGANLNSSLSRLNPSPEIQIQFLKIERQTTRGHRIEVPENVPTSR